MALYTNSHKYANVIIGNTGPASTTSSISIANAGSGYHNQVLTVANGTGSTAAPTWSNQTQMTAKGKLKLEGEQADILINDKSLSDWMMAVDRRLAILQPRPELLEKYEALQNLYDQYKTLEALIYQTPEEK